MTTVYTCTEPKDAWGLVAHFLGNQLFAISGACGMLTGNNSLKERAEEMISRSHIELIGNLYIIVRKMHVHGHADDASKIQQILNMITDEDVAKAEVRQAIMRKFDAVMAQVRAVGLK
jgi:hypothetical protein